MFVIQLKSQVPAGHICQLNLGAWLNVHSVILHFWTKDFLGPSSGNCQLGCFPENCIPSGMFFPFRFAPPITSLKSRPDQCVFHDDSVVENCRLAYINRPVSAEQLMGSVVFKIDSFFLFLKYICFTNSCWLFYMSKQQVIKQLANYIMNKLNGCSLFVTKIFKKHKSSQICTEQTTRHLEKCSFYRRDQSGDVWP